MQEARALIDSGALGPLMFIRGRYGHGGRLGYEREWRADPAKSGGGELMDQGVHLIDLAGWFLGPFTEVDGVAATYFWNMPIRDSVGSSIERSTASGIGTEVISIARSMRGRRSTFFGRAFRSSRS